MSNSKYEQHFSPCTLWYPNICAKNLLCFRPLSELPVVAHWPLLKLSSWKQRAVFKFGEKIFQWTHLQHHLRIFFGWLQLFKGMFFPQKQCPVESKVVLEPGEPGIFWPAEVEKKGKVLDLSFQETSEKHIWIHPREYQNCELLEATKPLKKMKFRYKRTSLCKHPRSWQVLWVSNKEHLDQVFLVNLADASSLLPFEASSRF